MKKKKNSTSSDKQVSEYLVCWVYQLKLFLDSKPISVIINDDFQNRKIESNCLLWLPDVLMRKKILK